MNRFGSNWMRFLGVIRMPVGDLLDLDWGSQGSPLGESSGLTQLDLSD